ncbi:beta-ketoacyl-ACP synthase II [Lacticaseibacillus pabuli]|uniref:3-oxoacyl-[acyl-carrier-protein] synthase 2 n=1 Tax=Lacticaseibacillus pabuli TaxID=3025672 RepID=A0ABY7WNY3_9LACO|nr:beta-ketoacyl-ACP synthase II [Lacticaseibacillus sp. KACC 23028]WDF81917.1 beta-ketoacyl-ACP synthase II [Lacticaseibacillus sp. KACC 23028]
MRRVVVTGMGTVNPLGNDLPTSVQAMLTDHVGIAPITKFDATETGISVAGELKDFDVTARIDRKLSKRLDGFTQYALYSAIEAAEQAQLTAETVDPERLAVIYGSGIGGLTTIQNQVTKMNAKGPKRVSPMFVPMSIINMAPGVLAQHFGAHGASYAVVTACASGTSAIGQAMQHIRCGAADVVITGGAEASVNEIGIAGFAALTALSSATEPQRASLPFGQHRSGFVMGEGAGTLILEEREHALARGAQILGEIVGYGTTSDAYHMTAPNPSGAGAAAAMQMAIADADLAADNIGYVNAHGTGTAANDAMESKAIAQVFADSPVLVSSTKSMTGHLLGAAGAIEAIFTIAGMNSGRLPANVIDDTQDADCPVQLVNQKNAQQDCEYALSNSFGFGGHNAVLAIKRGDAVGGGEEHV